jgi:opacity protein-like surface antigen
MLGGKRIAAALAALIFSTAAFAQGAEPAQRHLYVGAGGGQAQWRPGCSGGVPDCDDTNVSVHVFAGYQWNSYLAGEVAFTNYGKALGTNFEVKGRGWEASALASWPVFGSVSVLGRLGIYRGVLKGGGSIANTSEENYGPTYGFGAQMDFTPKIAARLEWQAYPGAGGSTIPDSDIKIISVSALWRFR